MTASKIQFFNIRPHSATNSYWQKHWDRIVPKTRGSIRIFIRLPFLCSGHLTGYGFWKLFRSKIPPLCVELRSKSCFLGKTRFTCTLPSWECGVNFHAGNNTGQASQLSRQNVNPVTQPPVHLASKTYGSCLSQQQSIPTFLAFTRE